MSNRRPHLIAAALATLAVGGLAIAQGSFDPPRRALRPVVTAAPELRAELAALQAAGKPAERLVPEPQLGDPLRIRVRLESVVDSHLQVSAAVAPDQIGRMFGVRVVMAREDIGDNTVFQDRHYVSYPLLDPEAEGKLLPLVGQEVELELKRSSTGYTFVSAWRSP